MVRFGTVMPQVAEPRNDKVFTTALQRLHLATDGLCGVKGPIRAHQFNDHFAITVEDIYELFRRARSQHGSDH